LFQNCANKKRGVLLPLIPLVQETSSPSQKSSNPSPISNTTNDVSNTNNNNDTPPPPPPVLVQFQTTSSSATEAMDSSVSIVVTLSSHLDTVVSVDYQVSGGTASSPSDYTLSTTTLTFNPGETQKSFTVTIIDNVDYVPMSRTVNFTLTNLSPALSLGTNSTHTLTIHEDINDVP
jgi:hypothetical protein